MTRRKLAILMAQVVLLILVLMFQPNGIDAIVTRIGEWPARLHPARRPGTIRGGARMVQG